MALDWLPVYPSVVATRQRVVFAPVIPLVQVGGSGTVTVGTSTFDSSRLTQFIDSFDYYATADRLMKWSTETNLWASGTSFFTITSAAGRRLNSNGLRLAIPGSSLLSNEGTLRETLAPGAYITAGFGFRFDKGLGHGISGFYSNGTLQCQLALNPNGTLSVRRGLSSGDVLGTTTIALMPNTFYFIEWSIFVDAAEGQIDVWVNGISRLVVNTVQTQVTGATANQCSIGLVRSDGPTTSATWDYDDVYMRTGDRRMDTLPFGDGRCVASIALTGNGAYTDFVPVTGVNHGDMVKDLTEDGDATINTASLTGSTDTYTYTDFDNVTSPIAVQSAIVGRTTGGTVNRWVANVFLLNGTVYEGERMSCGTTYTHLLTQYPLSPVTGFPFTIAELNAAEGGVKVVG